MLTTIHEVVAANDLVRRAYEFAKKFHNGHKQRNGEPFFNHCLATAEILAGWHLDAAAIAAGLLHHVPEDKDQDQALKKLKSEFGQEVSDLIHGVLQISQMRYNGLEHRTDNFRKFILYLSQDLRVILIKFASKLNTLKILYAYPQDLQKITALKAMEVYAPIANQIGMYKTAGDLQDLAFPYLYPADHQWLMTHVQARMEEREKYLETFKPILKNELEANGVSVLKIDSRAKHYFSLYKKLLRHEMDLDKIYDLLAVRIIVKDLSDCYNALGVIHKNWPPLAGRIKDYIASPKANGYKSLHTTVYAPEHQITEIQIRTPEIHHESELGVAAHFHYQDVKDEKSYINKLAVSTDLKELNLVKELRTIPKKLSDVSFFKNVILALTPKGDVIDLPTGSTPIDFAYKIHSDIGNHSVGVKINATIKPLNTALHSGDIVEILTDKKRQPSVSWLDFVKTGQAREKIKAALRKSKTSSLENYAPKTETEIKLQIQDQPGLVKEIIALFAKLKIKIKTFDIQTNVKTKFQILKIHCPLIVKEKLEKVSDALHRLKTIKKIAYKNQ